MSEKATVLGSCACESIKFVVTLPVRWCTHCHCRACRRQHGAAIVTWVGVAWNDFKLSGRKYLRWYVCSKDSKTGFCNRCGTSLLFMSMRWPDEVHVTRANLHGKINPAPGFHIHFDQHVDWFPFEDSLPRLGGKGGIEPMDKLTPPLQRRREDP